MALWLKNPTRNLEVADSIPCLFSGLGIQRCHELWCRLQTRIWYCCCPSSGWRLQLQLDPSQGTSICCGCSPEKEKKKRKKDLGHMVTTAIREAENMVFGTLNETRILLIKKISHTLTFP